MIKYSLKTGRIVSFVILITLFLHVFFFCHPVYAKSPETVKVGYYENEVFEEGASEGAVKTGYAYEYYRKLSEYTGWEYEYVYGSYSELYDMLLSGQIDLLAGLAKRDDRVGIIGYPTDPMGNETYVLVRHDDDTSITYSPSSISGKKIGVLKSAIEDVLKKYLASHSIDADIVTFDDYESLFAAFDKKDVDVLAAEGDGAYGRDHAEVLSIFGTTDYYLCVSISRSDLLEELDTAQSLLAAEEPGYLNSLRSKYYSSSVSGHTFSAAEREWMAQNNSLKIGYLNNYLPYCSTASDGEVTGIIKDIIPGICSELALDGLDISYTGYDNYSDMIEAVRNETIDVAFPVGGGLYYSEENGIYQSTAVASSTTNLVYKGDFEDVNTTHFAVNENNRMQYYFVKTYFPEAEITFYPNIDACLEAVLNADAGATTLNGLRANDILKNRRYKGLYLLQLKQTDDRCFGVKIGNEGLLKLLNRGINILGPGYAQDISYRYANELYSYTLTDLIRDNTWLFLTALLLIALLIIFFIRRDLKRTRLANRMKSDFVSNMSHEIRTPITAILGMNEMIQYESEDPKILEYSDNIEKAGESLLGIINDILDFSKIESGHMELVKAAYSLPELLSDFNLIIRQRLMEKDLEFIMDVDEKLPVMPIGDMQKIRQVITNLLTNAVKYTREGSVQLAVKLVSVYKDGFTMEVAVSDTGIGIREEEKEKLYSAFDRLDIEKNRNIEGSGLGLAITRSLLSLMGSEIKVESTYGKGSCFSFVLEQGISDPTPIGVFEAASVRSGKDRKRRQPTFTAKDAKLLIVDDTPMNLRVVCGLLKRNTMQIDTAESGPECIEKFGEKDYDIVFLDHRMPNMDGVQTLAELKKKYPQKEKRTPIISLTANAFSAAREEMLKAGFTDYLPKPVTLADMEEVLLKYLPKEKINMLRDKEPSKEEEASDIPEGISEIKELNIQEGIDYCGDEEEYVEALNIFASSVEAKSAQLEEKLSSSDAQGLSLLVHSLKSTLKAIGAKVLSEKAAELEKAAKENDVKTLQSDLPVLIKEYRSLGAKLKDNLSDSEKES